jgi:hypothetical protein
VSFIRWVGNLVGSLGVVLGLSAVGAPADVAAVVGAAAGQIFSEGPKRSRAEVVADQVNHANRAQAYEAFGEAIAASWLTGGFLFTFKPPLVGYLHGMVGLMRSQRRFEEQTTAVMAALSTVLLYASTEMQEASASLLRAQTEGLAEISHHERGSPEATDAQARAGVPFGQAFVAWRKAAQADLGAPTKATK